MKRFIHQFCAAILLLAAGTLKAAGLSADDVARATLLAERYPWSTVRQRSAIANDAAGLGVQTVSIELDERKHQASGSRARVYQYDHATQMARRLDINLDEASVTRALTIDSVHLPLSQNEIDFARTAVENSDLLNRLREEQRRRGQLPFESLDALNIKAVVFEPDDETHPCFSQRCALLSLFDDTRTVFAIEPVVHFPSGAVRELGHR